MKTFFNTYKFVYLTLFLVSGILSLLLTGLNGEVDLNFHDTYFILPYWFLFIIIYINASLIYFTIAVFRNFQDGLQELAGFILHSFLAIILLFYMIYLEITISSVKYFISLLDSKTDSSSSNFPDNLITFFVIAILIIAGAMIFAGFRLYQLKRKKITGQ